MTRTTVACTSIASLTLLGAVALLAAGPLNPPPGAITSNYKTLTEVEPRIAISAASTPGDASCIHRITQPGSYYLTANLTGASGKNGIIIASSSVSLDLSGFALQGVAGSLAGVTTTGFSLSSISVRNGAVRSWGGSGVELGAVSNSSLIESIRANDNGIYGIRSSNMGVIRNCTATQNAATGIIGVTSSIVESSAAYLNTDSGIAVGTGCLVRDCIARGNGANGIDSGNQSVVSACSAISNGQIGIDVGTGSTVQLCASGQNGTDGIRVSSACLISGNTCTFNGTSAAGGAGVHATLGDNRIEGNNCAGADLGLLIDFAGNFIVKNTCSGNTTDWVIVPNNAFGSIFDRRAPASPAVNGFSASGPLNATDLNANYSY